MNSATWEVYLPKILVVIKEIKERIAVAEAAFVRRRELLRGNISKDLKRKVKVECSSETWTLRKEHIKRIQAFEMWIWHKMKKIS